MRRTRSIVGGALRENAGSGRGGDCGSGGAALAGVVGEAAAGGGGGGGETEEGAGGELADEVGDGLGGDGVG